MKEIIDKLDYIKIKKPVLCRHQENEKMSDRLGGKFQNTFGTGCWWLMSIILATRRQRSGGSWFKASLGKQFVIPSLEKPITKKGLVEWLEVWALSSSPSTKNKTKTITKNIW
jgi:hypothetical protein